MGIFSKLLGSNSLREVEKQLEDLYVPRFQSMMGMSLSQAKSTFRDLFSMAREEAQKDGTLNLPLDLGDSLLEKETKDMNIKSMLEKRRKEGVRDQDIRWWMNCHELERKMMLKVDQWASYTLFKKLVEEDGLTSEEAAKEVRKTHPFYGDSDDTSHASGEDRFLPFELKDRINIYIEKRAQENRQDFKEDIKKASSFNALIRKEIRSGNV